MTSDEILSRGDASHPACAQHASQKKPTCSRTSPKFLTSLLLPTC